MYPSKMVKSSDGFKDYFPLDESTPFRGGTEEIFKKWTDTDGNIFYQTLNTFTSGPIGVKTQCLCKVSQSGTVLEMVWRQTGTEIDPNKFPAKIDPKSADYLVFQRSKE